MENDNKPNETNIDLNEIDIISVLNNTSDRFYTLYRQASSKAI